MEQALMVAEWQEGVEAAQRELAGVVTEDGLRVGVWSKSTAEQYLQECDIADPSGHLRAGRSEFDRGFMSVVRALASN